MPFLVQETVQEMHVFTHSMMHLFIYLVLSVCQRALFQCLGIYGRKEDMPDLYNCGVKIRKE